jgi:hypothetical protein
MITVLLNLNAGSNQLKFIIMKINCALLEMSQVDSVYKVNVTLTNTAVLIWDRMDLLKNLQEYMEMKPILILLDLNIFKFKKLKYINLNEKNQKFYVKNLKF